MDRLGGSRVARVFLEFEAEHNIHPARYYVNAMKSLLVYKVWHTPTLECFDDTHTTLEELGR